MAPRINKTPDESQEIIDLYFKKLPRVKTGLFDATKKMLLATGGCTSLFGRRWWLNEYQKGIVAEVVDKHNAGSLVDFKGRPIDVWEHRTVAEALRQAANFRIQSPTSDMVCMGLIHFTEVAEEKGWLRPNIIKHHNEQPSIAYLTNEVHDSVYVECKTEMAEEIAGVLMDCMEHPKTPFDFPVPWVVDAKIGYSMGTMQKLKIGAN